MKLVPFLSVSTPLLLVAVLYRCNLNKVHMVLLIIMCSIISF